MRFAKQHNAKIIAVPYEIVQQIADTKSPPKELACLKKQENLPDFSGKFYVAMDDVNDPKNLVRLSAQRMRRARTVYSSRKPARISMAPKAQRAAMGSTFHVPIEVCGLKKRLAELKDEGVLVVSGSLQGGDALPKDITAACVVVGNEARGISDEVAVLSDVLYKIRIYGQAESFERKRRGRYNDV